jgi:hypothetical protein
LIFAELILAPTSFFKGPLYQISWKFNSLLTDTNHTQTDIVSTYDFFLFYFVKIATNNVHNESMMMMMMMMAMMTKW